MLEQILCINDKSMVHTHVGECNTAERMALFFTCVMRVCVWNAVVWDSVASLKSGDGADLVHFLPVGKRCGGNLIYPPKQTCCYQNEPGFLCKDGNGRLTTNTSEHVKTDLLSLCAINKAPELLYVFKSMQMLWAKTSILQL